MRKPKKGEFQLPPFTINYIMMTLAETYEYGMAIHNIREQWKITKGENVVVGVVDTGLPVHRDLDGQILDAKNFTKSPLEDGNGHSTHVCGIIAAVENGEGVVGIANKAKLVIAKALDDNGAGNDQSIAEAIRWCVDKKVDIINMSLGSPNETSMFFPLTKEAVKYAYSKNIPIICAAGNENAKKVGFPASMQETISVAAVDSNKQRANFSNRGLDNDFAACGVDILSTYKNNLYAELSGTSMACPQIAGIAALILSEMKKRGENINSPEVIRESIKKICIDLGPHGHDTEFGDGLPVFGHIEDRKEIDFGKPSLFKRFISIFYRIF